MWNDSGNGSSLPSSVIVPSGTFWTPDLEFMEVINVIHDGFHRQVVFSNGWVHALTSLASLQLSCQFDVTNFPYDNQTCNITLGPLLLSNVFYKLAKSSTS
ncbi:neuronal acetylcholine receptor subunit beta-3-like [Convolutriloba macropyga]|uniref:neuronal acetylcholine receptor subunit beta-3-like n=1 Tax=Convolutriloba macropyga TaxID=536237 RepID=UPI003F51C323